MRIAIVCDWLIAVGGAEKVLNEMLSCFPEADIFSIVDFIPQDKREIIHYKMVTTSFIQKLPWAKTKYRAYLPLMPLAIEQFDLHQYDIVISSSHAVAKGVLVGPDQLHICYCHSPMRYAWDLQADYLREANLLSGFKSWIVRWCLHNLRIWDYRTSNGVDYFIANSKFIARRIQKIYRRESTVIYPPVMTDLKLDKKQNFYVTASRLVPYKKINLIVAAFAKMPERELVVIGDGPQRDSIEDAARGYSNIKILGYLENDELHKYLARARAFIFAAEEDFGIIPVEAQASGTPVIAYARGGALESVLNISTVQDMATGVFFDEQTVPSIIEAVHEFEKNEVAFTVDNCVQNANRFANERFRNEFKDFVLNKFIQFKADRS